MGSVLCCQEQEDFDFSSHTNRCCCCQRCCASCCCSLCLPFLHTSGEQDTTISAQHASPSQSAGLLGAASVSDTHHGPPRPLPYGTDIRYTVPPVDCSRSEQNGADSLHAGDSALILRSGTGVEELLSGQRPKGADYLEGRSDVDNSRGKSQQNKIVGKGELALLMDDEEICPTCLEGYDKENPKIVTQCGHHFHLGCILEWMERSNNCCVCNKEMVFNESP
eukprot:c25198_g1_i1 orf=722-1387(-)